MNNEPVVWISEYTLKNCLQGNFTDEVRATTKETTNCTIPLYTHPVNTCKHGVDDGACKECYMESTHPVKLTDEEIYQTWVEAKNTALNTRGSDFVEVIFARAILRKASEK
jgi:acetyl-CoA carboxylase beta subunit